MSEIFIKNSNGYLYTYSKFLCYNGTIYLDQNYSQYILFPNVPNGLWTDCYHLDSLIANKSHCRTKIMCNFCRVMNLLCKCFVILIGICFSAGLEESSSTPWLQRNEGLPFIEVFRVLVVVCCSSFTENNIIFLVL